MKIFAIFFIISLSLIALITSLFVKLIRRAQTIEAIDIITKLRENKNIDESFRNFPKYYINLDRSEDRRKNMENEIKEYKLQNIKRVKAFDGKNLKSFKKGVIDGYNYLNKDSKHKKTELAVTMSHIKAIKTAYEDGHKYALIMEDDTEMTLVPYWDKNIDEIVKEIPEEADLVLLSAPETKEECNIFKAPKGYVGKNGVAYIITYKGMKKYLKYLDNNSFNLTNIKNIIWDLDFMSDMELYISSKNLFLHFNFRFGSANVSKNYRQIFCKNSHKVLKSYAYNKVAS